MHFCALVKLMPSLNFQKQAYHTPPLQHNGFLQKEWIELCQAIVFHIFANYILLSVWVFWVVHRSCAVCVYVQMQMRIAFMNQPFGKRMSECLIESWDGYWVFACICHIQGSKVFPRLREIAFWSKSQPRDHYFARPCICRSWQLWVDTWQVINRANGQTFIRFLVYFMPPFSV